MDCKKKERILASIVRSFPIYELLQIRIEGRRYPRRRISLQRVGCFDTEEHAKEAMYAYINQMKTQYKLWEREKGYYTDCLGYYIFEVPVCNKESSFYWNQPPQKCYSFTADGDYNDCVALDEFGWYRGRKTEDIRFKVGDIVEVVDGDFAELAIVGGLPLTAERYHYLEEDEEEEEHPSRFIDESDDCYLVYPLSGEEGTHYHPVCYKVFRPTRPLSKGMAERLKSFSLSLTTSMKK